MLYDGKFVALMLYGVFGKAQLGEDKELNTKQMRFIKGAFNLFFSLYLKIFLINFLFLQTFLSKELTKTPTGASNLRSMFKVLELNSKKKRIKIK